MGWSLSEVAEFDNLELAAWEAEAAEISKQLTAGK